MKPFADAVDRRVVLAGLASLAVPVAARAEDTASPLAHGALANNLLAKAFEAFNHPLPDVNLVGPNGERGIGELKGRTILMPIWAEWCAPCLSEFPDFARLQQKYGNSKFAIIPVLSGTQKQFTDDVLIEMFSLMHASVFEPLQESMHGSSLARTMGRRGTGYALPCNLLIGPDGRAVAREIGLEPKNKPAGDDAHSSAPGNYRAETLNKVQAGESLSLWGEAPGDEFVAALANGFLDSPGASK